MASTADIECERTVREVMAYLRANPDAADTLAGVGVWLEGGGFHHPLGVIERALGLLVSRRLVRAERLVPGGDVVYRAWRSLPQQPPSLGNAGPSGKCR